MEVKRQRIPTEYHSVAKFVCSTNRAPPIGPRVWAADQAIVYNAAYCPLLEGCVRAIQ